MSSLPVGNDRLSNISGSSVWRELFVEIEMRPVDISLHYRYQYYPYDMREFCTDKLYDSKILDDPRLRFTPIFIYRSSLLGCWLLNTISKMASQVGMATAI